MARACSITPTEGATSATPSTATTALAARTDGARKLLSIKNADASATIRYSVGGTAGANSAWIDPGGSYSYEAESIPQDAVSVFSTTASARYVIEEGL